MLKSQPTEERVDVSYSGAMITSKHLDAIDMAKHRRRPLEDTPHTRAYVEMLSEVAAFHDALVQANPSRELLDQMTASLAEMRTRLANHLVAEHERWYARGELSGSKTQVLMPSLTLEHVDDVTLRAHTVVGEYFMGLNGAMHGGVVSVLFDTAMGRLAMGTVSRTCRTAYLTTQYRSITPIGKRLELSATVDSVEGRKRFISAQLWHEDTLCAEADALFVELLPGQQ